MTSGRTTAAGIEVAWGRDAHAMIRDLIADPSAEIGRRCPRCDARDHGRPVVVGGDAPVSISYAGDLAVVAVAAGSEAVGVDVERDRPGILHELRALFAPADPPDVRGWTMLEAAAKADGRGLRLSPAAVRALPGIETHAVPAPPGYVISVAVRH